MTQFKSLPRLVRAYVCTVVAAGALVLGLSAHSLLSHLPGSEWLILAALTILTGSFSVKVTSVNAYISVSEAFVFASVLLFGPEAGTVTVLLECLVILFWMSPQGRPVHRAFFNLAAPAVSIWIAGTVLYGVFPFQPYSEAFTPLPKLFLPLAAFTAIYFVLNSSLVAIAVGLETKKRSFSIWWESFAWMSVNYYSGASLAAIIVTYAQKLELSTLAAIGPLLVVSYLTFRTAMGRAEDSYNHLSQLNKLYLSTIETLAMAIDAKDQITHGHIRRVQAYAVGLAKKLDLGDADVLKAIEAAALLHDMGKLAVPEHILNKPGKLTPAEFEKMKQHAGIGADILSAIEFPYPVVPIVRHHHENWDGTGYPTGIRGTDIPIGARILSVVDCFDALTSDRPYRPKLSDEEAIQILVERRGSMYDPLVVDMFVSVHREIAPEHSNTAVVHKGALTEITAASGAIPSKAPEFVGHGGAAPLASEVVHGILDSTVGVNEMLRDVVAVEVHAELVAFYRYDGGADVLRIAGSSAGENFVGAAQVSLGERLSGWVAANRRSICNSDPALDLGEAARRHAPALTFTLSVPVVAGRELVGVLTAYRSSEFTAVELGRLEQCAKVLSERTSEQRNGSSGASVLCQGPVSPVSSFIALEILNAHVTNAGLPGAEWLNEVAATIKRCLGPNDLLLQNRDHEFVALLGRADAIEVRNTARAIRTAVSGLNDSGLGKTRIEFSVETVVAPADYAALWDLIPVHDQVGSPLPAPTKVH